MKKTNYKAPKDKADVVMNIVIGAVIVAVLGAGVYAVYPKVSESIQNNSTSSESAAINNAGDAAKEKGMSFDEFAETYGLGEDITKDTELSEAIGAMPLEKVALYNDTDVETFRANNFIPESITNDTKWSDVIPQLPVKAVVGGEETVNQIISIYGLEGKITPDTPWGEAEPIMNAAQEELMQAQANAQAAQAEQEAQSSEGAEVAESDAPAETAKADKE